MKQMVQNKTFTYSETLFTSSETSEDDEEDPGGMFNTPQHSSPCGTSN